VIRSAVVALAVVVWLTIGSSVRVAEAVPPNDNFAAATAIPASPFLLPFTDTAATGGWSLEPGEPLPDTSCDGAFNMQGSAWYTFTPTASGPYDFDTFGSTFDTVIRLYVAGAPPSFATLTPIACNNDAYHFAQPNRSLKVPNIQSSVGADLAAGATYYIQVLGNQGAGNMASDVLIFHTMLSYYPPPPGGPCQQDHAADTNGNGYSDADEATPKPPGCSAYPAAGGFGVDPMPVGLPIGCYTDPLLARGDINLDGAINGLDLGLFAAQFGKTWQPFGPASVTAESDLSGDYFVNGLDLNALAARFLMSVPGNCSGVPGGGGPAVCSLAALLITTLPPGGCATATRTLNADGTDTVTFFWDRTAPGPHTLDLVGVGCPPPVILGSLPMTVGTPSGQAAVLLIAPPPPSCVATFDGTPLWP